MVMPHAWVVWLGCMLLATVVLAGEAPPQLRVLSYNVNAARVETATLEAIAAADADLVLLQETSPEWERALRRRFAAAYAHFAFHHWRPAYGGLAVLSRHPIDVDELLPPAAGWFPAQRLVVAAPIGRIQVLHVHLRPAIDQGDRVRGYFTTPPIRRREIEAYWRRMVADLPTLAAGDFNEEPGANALAYLADRGLTRVDTGATATWEWKGMWQGRPIQLAMKLDHVLVDGRLAVRDARVIIAGRSDHRPVEVTLERAPP